MYENFHMVLIQTKYDVPLSQIMVFQATYQHISNKTVSGEISWNVHAIHIWDMYFIHLNVSRHMIEFQITQTQII